jgi:hypothetical protein
MRPSRFLKPLVTAICISASSGAGAGATPWAGSDYVNLYFRIYNGQVPLPHLRDEKQKALFNHLIDPENLASIQSAAVSDDTKRQQLEIILASLSAYRSRYNYAIFVGEPLAQELAMVQAYQLQVMGCMAKLSPPGTKTGISHPAWITLIGAVIDAVESQKTYSPTQSAIMAEAIAHNYPAIALALSSNERNIVFAEASRLDAAADNPFLNDALEQMKRGGFGAAAAPLQTK